MSTERSQSPDQAYRGIIGIDLGTTNSLVTFMRDGNARIIPNERGDRITPSVVHFKEDGNMVVGEMAKTQAVMNAERTVMNVKLKMGSDHVYAVDEASFTPADISALILNNLKTCAERYLGGHVTEAVITVPAYFDDRQREDTVLAAEKAGLKVRKLLNEPTAAALTYGMSEKENNRLLVIDLGGGTFDVTLMEYTDRVFRVRGVGGSTNIGGLNFDRKIVEHVLGDFRDRYGIDLSTDKIAYQQIIIHSEKAKKDLSSAETTRIMAPYIAATDKGPIHLNMEIRRQDFEKMISPILEEIRLLIAQTFEHAGLTPNWVQTVILVGGSTRVPALERLVAEILGIPETLMTPPGGEKPDQEDFGQPKNGTQTSPIHRRIRKNINPDEAVARGAGIMAGILAGQTAGIEFFDITPHDLGLEDDQGTFVTILRKGTSYPTEASRLFTTTEDDQAEVCIHVLQRMGLDNERQVSLGWFHLSVNTARKRGEINIDVSFGIDESGRLHVTAVDIDSGEHDALVIRKSKLFSLSAETGPTVGKAAKIVSLKNHINLRRK